MHDVDGCQRDRVQAIVTELTARERGILALMAEGASNPAICQALWLSRKTVESHVGSIFRKLMLPPDGTVDRRVLAVVAYLQAYPERAAA